MSKVVVSKVMIHPLIINKFIFRGGAGGKGKEGVRGGAKKKEE
jgi:hypothetical protein